MLLEKEVATHSSIFVSRIPGTEEPGGLPSVGLHRVGHDWRDLAAAALHAYYSLNGIRILYWLLFPSFASLKLKLKVGSLKGFVLVD